MLKVKEGDREAFNQLVQRYSRPLVNFIYRFTANPAESEDLAQEVFLRVFQSAAKYQVKASFSTWIYRIATNVALKLGANSVLFGGYDMETAFKYLAKAGYDGIEISAIDEKSELNDNDDRPLEIQDSRALVDEQLVEKERARQIRTALSDLPENQRLAVVLTKYQELSIKEAAQVLKCSEQAVKSLIFRAYATLRERLGVMVTTQS